MSNEKLSKSERICEYHLIEQIFSRKEGGSLSHFPLRLIYYPSADGNKILISVPKRHFKRAVDRNRIKRQVREAYRKNKSLIANCSFAIAFIWTAGKMLISARSLCVFAVLCLVPALTKLLLSHLKILIRLLSLMVVQVMAMVV